TGKQTGTEIAEVYAKLPKVADESFKRLAGWSRVTLAPGESKTVTVAIDPRVLKTFNEVDNRWNLASGEYGVFVGPSSEKTLLTGSLLLP
ncbi:MAG: fibronectin type III-like domain-contianing protein, partial [Candidatus Korobacteraceae bacterium]